MTLAGVRLAGRITEWNDAKGYGFVVPNGGGDRAFVHVSQLGRRARRPQPGDHVSYVVVTDERGRLNAQVVRAADGGVAPPTRNDASRLPRAAFGVAALATIAAVAWTGRLPSLIGGAYFGLSLVSWALYWFDKRAAGQGARRTPESTLHLSDLLGGWPGALVAQQQFRHKTQKQPFQTVFWITVIANLAGTAWLTARLAAGA